MTVPQAFSDLPSAGLDHGFRRLYDLDFTGGQKEFESWEKLNPENPMGPASEAAGILFSEFNRLGVLEAQFYADDSVFGARKKYEADPGKRARFDQQLSRAEDLAKSRLSRDPRDRDALLGDDVCCRPALGLCRPHRGKRNLAALHYTKEATAWSKQLFAVDPSCYDAHLAGGVSRCYIIGSMAAPVRWLVRLGGVSGDKAGGIAELQTTAAQRPSARPIRADPAGHRLRPARKTCRALMNSWWGCNGTFQQCSFGRELARLNKNGRR